LKLKMGLIVNPVAGVGGSAGLKGSDGELIQTEAIRRGASYRAVERAKRFLKLARLNGGDDIFRLWF